MAAGKPGHAPGLTLRNFMSDTPDRIYPIKHNGYWFYAGRAADQQVLIAAAGSGVAALFFDGDGVLVQTKQMAIPERFPSYDYAAWESALREGVDRYAHEIGLVTQTIQVRRFEAPEVGFQIQDPAWHIAEAKRDLQLRQKPAAELSVLARVVADWEAEGLFVLRLDGDEFWLDGEGGFHSH